MDSVMLDGMGIVGVHGDAHLLVPADINPEVN